MSSVSARQIMKPRSKLWKVAPVVFLAIAGSAISTAMVFCSTLS